MKSIKAIGFPFVCASILVTGTVFGVAGGSTLAAAQQAVQPSMMQPPQAPLVRQPIRLSGPPAGYNEPAPAPLSLLPPGGMAVPALPVAPVSALPVPAVQAPAPVMAPAPAPAPVAAPVVPPVVPPVVSAAPKDVPKEAAKESPKEVSKEVPKEADVLLAAKPIPLVPPVTEDIKQDAPPVPTFGPVAPAVVSNTAAVVPPKSPSVVFESWRARKGEVVRDVLQRWSQRSGIDLMWASPDSPRVKEDFTYVGSFQNAANRLVLDNGKDQLHSQYRSEGLNPVMMSPASTITTNPPPMPDEDLKKEGAKSAEKSADKNPLAKIFEKTPEKKEMPPETRWFGLSGSPLVEVIKVWAEDAGVRVIWNSEKNFALKESVSQVGHFEDAVSKALTQYDNDQVRPVGEMYVDPQNGQKVLVVRSDVQ